MFLRASHGFPTTPSEQSHRGLLHGEDEAVVDVQRTRHGAIGAVAWPPARRAMVNGTYKPMVYKAIGLYTTYKVYIPPVRFLYHL